MCWCVFLKSNLETVFYTNVVTKYGEECAEYEEKIEDCDVMRLQ